MLARIVPRIAAACGALALTLAALPAPAFANWGTTARFAVGARESYNDSLFIRSASATTARQNDGDAITTLEPGFSLRYESDHARHDLTWTMSFQKFARHDELDNLENRLFLDSLIDHSARTRTSITDLLIHGNVNTVSEAAAPGLIEPGVTGAMTSGAQTYVYDILKASLEHDWSETTIVRARASAEAFRPIGSAAEIAGTQALAFEAGPELEIESPRNLYRMSASAGYALLEGRPDFLTGEVRGRVTRDLTDRIEGRLELGAAVATDAAHRHDVFWGPVGEVRFKYENERQRIIVDLEHAMGANVEYRTIEAEDTLGFETEYMLREEWYAFGGVSGSLKRFVLPGAGSASDFQRIAVASIDVGLEWAVSDGLTMTAHYQGRVQRATTQVLPTGQQVPFDLDYTRNLVTIGLEVTLPSEPRPPRLATDERERQE